MIDERVAPREGDFGVRKTRVGLFATTDLRVQLEQRGITTLELTWISTSGVVLSAFPEAVDLDYRVVVLVGKVFPRPAEVVTATELLDALR